MFRRIRRRKSADQPDETVGLRKPEPQPAEAESKELAAPAAEVAETEVTGAINDLSRAIAGLRLLIGEEQLDVRARVTNLEERIGVLEHMVGELVAARRRKAKRLAAGREGQAPAVAAGPEASTETERGEQARGAASADSEDAPAPTPTGKPEGAHPADGGRTTARAAAG